MFTGLISHIFKVSYLDRKTQKNTLKIISSKIAVDQLRIGDSISINGICLTVTSFEKDCNDDYSINFHILDETLKCTNLKCLKLNEMVNFERALKYGHELGGHMVTGHISDCAKLESVNKIGSDLSFCFSMCKKWLKYLVPKTHIAINGISLTLVNSFLNKDICYFEVRVIPLTFEKTNLQFLKSGNLVNVEFNTIVKTAVSSFEHYKNIN